MKFSSKKFSTFVIIIAVAIAAALYFRNLPQQTSQSFNNADAVNNHIGNIASFETKAGLKVMYLYAPELPMVDVQLMLNAGAVNDGEKLGLAALTSRLLDRGTKLHNVDSFADELASVGAMITQNVTKDYASVGLRTLTDKHSFDVATGLFYEVLQAPAFEQQSFELRQAQQLASIKLEKQQPANFAGGIFYKLIYRDHPYGKATNGTAKTVESLTVKDVQDFFATHYGNKHAVLAIVGNITEQSAKKISEKVSAILAEHKQQEQPLEKPPATKSHDKKVAFPSEQTHIYYGTLGVKRGEPDYFPLYVGNHILGGGELSRLYEGIREKEGMAYSVYSAFIASREPGPFIIAMQTRNEVSDKALKSAQDILQDYVTKGPSEDELIAAKKYITGNFPLRVSSNSDMVGYLAMIGYYNLPLNYLLEFNRNIEKVTVEDIHDAFKRHINTNEMVTVMVGKINGKINGK